MQQDSVSILKEYYSRFLLEIRGLSPSSVNHYIDALNNISRRLKAKELVIDNIYEITNLEYLAHVRDTLYADPDFIQMNERGRRMYSAGLNNYFRFASGEDFQLATNQLVKLDIPFAPEKPVLVEQKIYKRSNILRTQTLTLANYTCELDRQHTSFIAEATKKPYMEGHHIIPMKLQESFNSSLDVYANIICLCPMCHRRIHFGIQDDRRNMVKKIYFDRAERLANSGLRLSSEEFTAMAIGG